jgi:outer membrane lipopolysaccharide assembly protein LptE/RlpB
LGNRQILAGCGFHLVRGFANNQAKLKWLLVFSSKGMRRRRMERNRPSTSWQRYALSVSALYQRR